MSTDLLDSARLGAYLARVGYDGPLAPTVGTLHALHRAHLTAIPYENLDIHLGRTLTLDRQATFAKLVDDDKRGGCVTAIAAPGAGPFGAIRTGD